MLTTNLTEDSGFLPLSIIKEESHIMLAQVKIRIQIQSMVASECVPTS